MVVSDAFVDLPDVPPLVQAAELRPLSLGDVLRAQRRGATLLDTRSSKEFASGHLAGSVLLVLGGGFAAWAEALLPAERAIVLVATPGREEEAAARLRRVGFDRVSGFLQGGIEDMSHLVALVRHPARISSALLCRRLARGPATLIDVRPEDEWRRGAIPGSINIPLEGLRERIGDVPAGPVVVYCRTGERSCTAASLLEQTGRMNIVDLVGGFAGWQAAHSSTTAELCPGHARD
jgi:hydroxyacylglutathione hydrolase